MRRQKITLAKNKVLVVFFLRCFKVVVLVKDTDVTLV